MRGQAIEDGTRAYSGAAPGRAEPSLIQRIENVKTVAFLLATTLIVKHEPGKIKNASGRPNRIRSKDTLPV
jgi:hypothetical protein